MSDELDSLRARALAAGQKTNQAQIDRVKEREGQLLSLARKHLPEWVRTIDKAVAAGKIEISFEFRTKNHAHYEWERWEDESSAPRTNLCPPASNALEEYGKQLQKILGEPFSVSVHFLDVNSESLYPSPDAFTISWVKRF